MRNQLESQEQIALFQWIDLMSNKYPQLKMAFHIPNGGHRHIGVARKLKAEGVKPGVPDIFLAFPKPGSCWPHGPGMRGLFIEMKSEKGKLSKEQESWIFKLRASGYQAEVCHSWISAAKLMCEYLGIEATGL